MIRGWIAQAVDPETARERAQEILDERRFQKDAAPRPFRGPLQWIGDRLRPIAEWIGDVLGQVPWWAWLGIALAIVAAVITRVVFLAQRRMVTGADRLRRGDEMFGESEDPDALERDADAAERDGDLDRALRLRFRAGLLRLGARGAIDYRPSVTTGEVRQVLGSETFDELARTFESVAYGGEPAQPPDVAAARREWPRVLDETRRR
jgi:hypothetical protein